jgi:predicted enzyme related to lactoylglutathione lyase
MSQPVVHFEIIGANPDTLREYYRDLFGWTFNDNAPVAQAYQGVSAAGRNRTPPDLAPQVKSRFIPSIDLYAEQ